MSDNPFDPKSLDELPTCLPIFPLSGATLLPGTQLPLNIFEPRYLNMVLDALKGPRLIGMLQPDPARETGESVVTYDVGCAGRIVAFNETGDGRLLISLQGVCRFRLGEELPLKRGYRRVVPQWDPYSGDLLEDASLRLSPDALRAGLEGYLERHGVRVDWESLEKVSPRHMVDFLCMHLPLEPEEKQALLQAPGAQQRAEMLLTITDMSARSDVEGISTRH